MTDNLVKTILISAVAAILCGILPAADSEKEIAREILAIERRSLDGWLTGNPDPLLASLDPEITYFHVMTEKRLDGIRDVKALCEQFRGRPLFPSYEMVDPKVQVSGDVAVLTYIFLRGSGPAAGRWNATQVYRRKTEGWRVIHTHFSQTNAAAPAAP